MRHTPAGVKAPPVPRTRRQTVERLVEQQNAIFDINGRHRRTPEATTTRLRPSSPPEVPLRDGQLGKVRSDSQDAENAFQRISGATVRIRSFHDRLGASTPDCRLQRTSEDSEGPSVPSGPRLTRRRRRGAPIADSDAIDDRFRTRQATTTRFRPSSPPWDPLHAQHKSDDFEDDPNPETAFNSVSSSISTPPSVRTPRVRHAGRV